MPALEAAEPRKLAKAAYAGAVVPSGEPYRNEITKPNSSETILPARTSPALDLSRTFDRPAPERRLRLHWSLLIPLLLLAVGWAAAQLLGLRVRVPVAKSGEKAYAQPVVMKSAPTVVSAAGQVEPASEELKIGASAPGRLLEVPVQEGQRLLKGDVIAVLDNSDLTARVAQAEANVKLREAELERLVNGSSVYERQEAATGVAEAQALLDNAKAEVAQRRGLLASGDISRAEVERWEREVRLAQTRLDKASAYAATVNSPARDDDRARTSATLLAATAQLEEAKALLDRTVVRAPFNGVVLKRYHQAGEEVRIGSDPIVSFGDLSSLVVRVAVDEADVGKIRVGNRAYCTAQAYGAQRFAGRVIHIGGQLGRKNIETGDPAEKVDTRVLETLIALDGRPRLPIGLRVDAFIDIAPPPRAKAGKKTPAPSPLTSARAQ
jgi:HlyD family secretion protein